LIWAKTGGMYVIDIEECADCEQLIFPGEEVYETPAGDVCMTCGTLSEKGLTYSLTKSKILWVGERLSGVMEKTKAILVSLHSSVRGLSSTNGPHQISWKRELPGGDLVGASSCLKPSTPPRRSR